MLECKTNPRGEEIRTLLLKAKLKRTPTREALLAFLEDNQGPFSVSELARSIKVRNLDSVTLYRCLAAFERTGIVSKRVFSDGRARFELKRDSNDLCPVVVCKDCRKVDRIEPHPIPRLSNKVKKMGYSNITLSLEFSGICSDCLSA